MDRKLLKTFTAILGVLAVIAVVGIWSSNSIPKVAGSAPSGYQANGPTSSKITLSGVTAYTLFASSTQGCVSRIITTRSREILFKFHDNAIVLDANTGHIQKASTTVAYDSGLYGCGLWTGIVIGSTTAAGIDVTEFNGFR